MPATHCTRSVPVSPSVYITEMLFIPLPPCLHLYIGFSFYKPHNENRPSADVHLYADDTVFSSLSETVNELGLMLVIYTDSYFVFFHNRENSSCQHHQYGPSLWG